MSLHVRRQIVLAIVECLAREIPEATVKAGRAAPLPTASLPHLLVHARREAAVSVTSRGDQVRLQRRLSVLIDVLHADAEDDDGAADAFCLQVELAMQADPTLGGLLHDLEGPDTTLDARAEGETRIGRARLEYQLEYHTTALRPDQHLE
jgi:hypothetical protein